MKGKRGITKMSFKGAIVGGSIAALVLVLLVLSGKLGLSFALMYGVIVVPVAAFAGEWLGRIFG